MSQKSDKDPNFEKLQAEWYDRLAKEGFEDAEDTNVKGFEDGRPLKRWTGISSTVEGDNDESYEMIDYIVSQPAESDIISSFPDPIFSQEEAFLNNPDFLEFCKTLCEHGNFSLSPKQVASIWLSFCEGLSQRAIAEQQNTSSPTVCRVVQKLTDWMNLQGKDMDNETTVISTVISTVILRAFNPDTDSAFVYSSWRNNLWYDEKRDDRLSDQFYSLANKEIKKLLKNPATKVRIACLSDNHDQIIGYSVMTGDNLEWVYVKVDYRVKKIGTLLTKGFKTVSQPITKIGKSITANKNLTIKDLVGGTGT